MTLRKFFRWLSEPRVHKTHAPAWFPAHIAWVCEDCGMIANGLSVANGCLACGSHRVLSVRKLVEIIVRPIRTRIAEHREESRTTTRPPVENTAMFLTAPGLENWSLTARKKKPAT